MCACACVYACVGVCARVCSRAGGCWAGALAIRPLIWPPEIRWRARARGKVAFGSFSRLFFQYVGFSDPAIAAMLVFSGLCGASGNYIGGAAPRRDESRARQGVRVGWTFMLGAGSAGPGRAGRVSGGWGVGGWEAGRCRSLR